MKLYYFTLGFYTQSLGLPILYILAQTNQSIKTITLSTTLAYLPWFFKTVFAVIVDHYQLYSTRNAQVFLYACFTLAVASTFASEYASKNPILFGSIIMLSSLGIVCTDVTYDAMLSIVAEQEHKDRKKGTTQTNTF